VEQQPRLIPDRFYYARVAVSGVGNADPAGEVEIFVSVGII
jgi:hypothetical protein